jgi:tRNA 2-selenouridine synthase
VQRGSDEAMLKGLEIIGPKMKLLVEQAVSLAPGKEVLLYCWRGGMRSNSMAWLFNTTGMKAYALEGGYKSYRAYAHGYFEKPLNLVVIGGMTGSGKTRVLEEIARQGEQVIHLEELASHKGSVFGHLGMKPQPTTEQFENDLFTHISALDSGRPVFVEDESLAIGAIFMPETLYRQMSGAVFIRLDTPVEDRIRLLLEEYTSGDPELIVQSIARLERRLGSENMNLAMAHVREGRMKEAIAIVLQYYDKVYQRSMGRHRRRENLVIRAGGDIPSLAAQVIAAGRASRPGQDQLKLWAD